MKFFALIFLVFIIKQCNSEAPEQFIVRVGHYLKPQLSASVSKCFGAVISEHHVLTTADCATLPLANIQTWGISIIHEVDSVLTSRYLVSKIEFHPSYKGHLEEFNIALIFVDVTFLYTKYPTLPTFDVTRKCNVYGWGGKGSNPRNESVEISLNCESLAAASLCTIFESTSNEICEVEAGSPLICGDDSVFTGFSVNRNQCAITHSGKVILSYQTIAPHRKWLEEVLETEKGDPYWDYTVDVVEYENNENRRMRTLCVGTVISEWHVLTTAECVTTDTSGRHIGVEGYFNTSDWSNDHEVNVYIHPEFKITENFSNNIAIIKTSRKFEGRMKPRLLDELPKESSESNFCQLVHWGNRPSNTEQTVIAVDEAKFCHPNKTQIFCSKFFESHINLCKAQQGSPVFCGNNTVISGFLLNDGRCDLVGERYSLDFHSVGDFKDWIKEVSGGESLAKTSKVMLMLTIIVFMLQRIL